MRDTIEDLIGDNGRACCSEACNNIEADALLLSSTTREPDVGDGGYIGGAISGERRALSPTTFLKSIGFISK
jgi:hypothetical protein